MEAARASIFWVFVLVGVLLTTSRFGGNSYCAPYEGDIVLFVQIISD